ncbi:MAG: SGNH/GDSL hydrolase family protein [Candidatus Pacearchaeota archaeon]
MKYQEKITLILVGLIIGIVLLEVLFRMFYFTYSNYNTEMWRYSKELKKASNIPGLTHEHVPNKSVFLYGVEIKTNSLGLRSNTEYEIRKSENITRILILGDSIVLGWGVPYENIFSEKLNENLGDNYEVINAGVGNYNTKSELSVLNNLLYLKPDKVILVFYLNDFEEVKYSDNFIIKNSYLYNFLFDKFISIKYKDNSNYYLNLIGNEEAISDTKDSLVKMINIAKEENIEFVLVYFPDLRNLSSENNERVKVFIETIKRENPEIIYIDLSDSFKGFSERELWVSNEDAHPNAIAHKIVADKIYKELKSIG